MEQTGLLQTIEKCGIVGAGGAGFPSHVKYNAKADTLILNAAECEPLMHKDKEILKRWPAECMDGVRKVMAQVGAKRGIIAIKEKYKEVFEALAPHMQGLEFLKMGNYYPAGDELVLVWEATGRVVAPGNIPLSVGCVVTNVETVLNVQRAKPVVTSFLSIVGEVKKPQSLEVTVGMTVQDVLDYVGGPTCDDPVFLMGGVMMGRYSENASELISKTTGGIVVLNRDHDLIRRYTRPAAEYNKIAKASCDQCNFCTELCPRYLLGHPIEPHKNMRNMGFKATVLELVQGAEFCCECNLCSFYACPEDLDPKNVSTDLKRMIQQKAKSERMSFKPGSVEAHGMAKYRKAPIPKLMKKLQIDHFVNKAPLAVEILVSSRVAVPLKQHVGSPCTPVVKTGDKVRRGDVIGKPEGLGALIHASIDGVVKSVGQTVVIEG